MALSMNNQTGENPESELKSSITMESMNRVSELPVVKSTVQIAQDIYGKVKESHPTVTSVLTTAETSVKQATEAVASTVAVKFEGPIKKVDSVLCSSLDYVEEKVPGIKLPPSEMYASTKSAIASKVEPAIECVCALKEYGLERVSSLANNLRQNNCEKCRKNAQQMASEKQKSQ